MILPAAGDQGIVVFLVWPSLAYATRLISSFGLMATGLAIQLANGQSLPGVVLIAAFVVGMPVFLYWAVKVIPNTRFGQRLALRRKPADPGEGTPEADDLARLVGVETTADTVLRPSGTVRVDGRRIVAQAESDFIEKGAKVKIIRAAGTHVIVREVES